MSQTLSRNLNFRKGRLNKFIFTSTSPPPLPLLNPTQMVPVPSPLQLGSKVIVFKVSLLVLEVVVCDCKSQYRLRVRHTRWHTRVHTYIRTCVHSHTCTGVYIRTPSELVYYLILRSPINSTGPSHQRRQSHPSRVLSYFWCRGDGRVEEWKEESERTGVGLSPGSSPLTPYLVPFLTLSPGPLGLEDTR